MAAALQCLTWTALFTLLLLALLQNRSSKWFFFFTVLVTSLGPTPQSSTQCQQSFPCCTVCLVWLALGARKIPYGHIPLKSNYILLYPNPLPLKSKCSHCILFYPCHSPPIKGKCSHCLLYKTQDRPTAHMSVHHACGFPIRVRQIICNSDAI